MPYNYTPGNARDLEKKGMWFRDREGRYATFRGVNMSSQSKLADFGYLPFRMEELNEILRHLDRLRDAGFNVVRLLVIWKALERDVRSKPEELTDEGRRYLENIRRIIDALYDRGLFVFIDFHQDIAHEWYGGDGFPDWARAIEPGFELPPEPAGFRNKLWALKYQFDASVRHTLGSFWRNSLRNARLSASDQNLARNVRNHYVMTLRAIADWFQSLNGGSGHPAIMGYSIFNEPHETELDGKDFEQNALAELYRHAIAAIREVDSRSFIFIQPRVGWNQFTPDPGQITWDPTSDLNTSDLQAERVVFTYNFYDTLTLGLHLFSGLGDSMEAKQSLWPLFVDRMRAAAVWRGLIPLISELGAPQDWTHHTDLRPEIYHGSQTRAYMDIQMQQMDRYIQNFTYWNYSFYNTHEDKDGWNLEDFSLLGPDRIPRNIDIVTRPYAMRSSAEPTHGFFDLGTKHFALRLLGPVADAPTVIFVPRQLHYAGDFEIRASTQNALEWDEARQLLIWWPDKSKHHNLIVIAPFGRFQHSALPFFAREIFGVVNQPIRMPSPFGWLDQAVFVNNRVEVSGWAIDPETTASIEVYAQVDNVSAGSATANALRSDVGAIFPGYGNNHGFFFRLKAPMGTHRVCVFAKNAATGADVRLGCRDVFVPMPGPCGVIEAELGDLKQQLAFLEAEFARVPIRQRAVIFEQIQEVRGLLVQKEAELAECIKRELG